MAINNFKPFATEAGANVISQADYEVLTSLLSGFQSGKASSAQVNKVLRQATFISSVLAQFIADKSGNHVLDDGDSAALVASLIAALKANGASDFLQITNNLGEIAAAGNSAQLNAQENLGLGIGSALPVGTPIPWPLAIPPSGWLACNGGTFDLSANPRLAIAYPSGILPDLRGEFIRGWDNTRGVDPGRPLMSWQKGSYLLQEAAASVDRVVQYSLNDITKLGWDKAENNGDILRARSTADNSIGTWSPSPKGMTGIQYIGYSRPRNVAFNYIVRAA